MFYVFFLFFDNKIIVNLFIKSRFKFIVYKLYLSKISNSIFNSLYVYIYKLQIRKFYLNSSINLKGNKDKFINYLLKDIEVKEPFTFFSFLNKK
jgi:hypothetical protein